MWVMKRRRRLGAKGGVQYLDTSVLVTRANDDKSFPVAPRSRHHQHTPETTAQPAYPQVVALEAFKNGGELAIYHQLELVAEHYSPRMREFAFDAATAVALTFCEHEDHPLALPRGLSSKERKAAASAHPGLCGVSLAAVIAGVAFGDVSATAERRGVPATYRAFRNQACFNASKELNAFGAGVELKRIECFAQACRALFPGDGAVEEWAGAAFNS